MISKLIPGGIKQDGSILSVGDIQCPTTKMVRADHVRLGWSMPLHLV